MSEQDDESKSENSSTVNEPNVPERGDVPDALADRPQWLLFDTSAETERRPFGWDSETGTLDARASWRERDDWLTFEAAREAAAERDTTGVGFVLHESDPFGALDLDGCLRADSGPKKWLPSLSPFLGDRDDETDVTTFLDVSPSGDGLHVWFRNDDPDAGIPDWWSDQHFSDGEHEGVEAYSAKFFTVTGELLFGERADDFPADADSFASTTVKPIDAGTIDEWLREAHQAINGGDSSPWDPGPAAQTPGETDPDPVSFDGDDWFNEAEARDALSHINPNVSYPTWRDIGFALEDQFGESAARRLFTEWSRGGSKWDAEAERLTEDIVSRNADGGDRVTVATLIEHAKQAGWETPGEKWDSFFSDGDADLSLSVESDGGEPAESGDSGDESGGGSEDPADPADLWDAVQDAYRDSDTSKAVARQHAVNTLLKTGHYVTPRDSNHIWSYHAPSGVFERGGRRDIERIIEREIGPLATTREVREIVDKVKRKTQIERETFDAGREKFSDRKLLCVENGVLDLETRELFEHAPEYRFRTAIPTAYDPDAESDAIETFLSEVTRREADAQTLLEFIGYTLWPDHSLRAAFCVMLGKGANGKGIFETVTTKLLGSDNVASVPLETLTNQRFAAANLDGALTNIGQDIAGAKINDLSTIKSITGGDRVNVERKYEQSYATEIRAKPMFSVNNPPAFSEKTHAVARRIVPIPFPYEFTRVEGDGNKDARDERELLAELTSDAARSGFLNAALDGLDRLRETGDFSLPETPAERLELYEQYSDPIAKFASMCLENPSAGYVTKDAAHGAYVAMCEQEGVPAKAKSTFFRELRRTGSFDVNSARPRYGTDERVTALEKARLTAKGRDLCPPTSLEKSDQVNQNNQIDPRTNRPKDSGEPASVFGDYPDDPPEIDGESQERLVNDIRRAVEDLNAPEADRVKDVLAFAEDHDPERVEHQIGELKKRGELYHRGDGLDVT